MSRGGDVGGLRLWAISLALSLAVVAALFPGPAHAGPGYQLNSAKPSFPLGGELAHGVAVDQASQLVYVAVGSTNVPIGAPGRIEQFKADGVATAQSPFTTGANDYFAGVAVNPVTQDIFAYQTEVTAPGGGKAGTPRVNTFSSSGLLGPSFSPPPATGPHIAADSTGRLFYPSDVLDVVQVFDSAGTLKTTLTCAGCPGGAFDNPSSVALDGAANLYVVDLGSGRVIKFAPAAGGTYAYASILQSGRKAVAVAADPSSGDVFVGNLEGDYSIAAFNSIGIQFDEFGAGVFAAPPFEAPGQIAVNGTTSKLYVTDPGARKVWIFERVASIPAPSLIVDPASSLGQLDATLKATVNPKGHTLTECRFQYTEEADFEANGWANAVALFCPPNLGGSADTPVTASITGLVPGTTYAYRFLAASYGGNAGGGVQTFTTLPPNPPQVSTGTTTALEQTTATLTGTVDPRGGPISDCRFEYVVSAEFQASGYAGAKSVPCAPAKPSGAVAVPVTAKLADLLPGATYAYRVLATNNAGTAKGGDLDFTTLAETCATDPALCPPPPPPSTSAPPSPAAPATTPAATKAPSPPKCRKGFQKKRVKGKQRCVKLKKKRSR